MMGEIKYSPERFESLVNEFQTEEAKILNWKGNEYTEGVDRLQNFREIAAFHGGNRIPADIALEYMLKHVQSIKKAVTTRNYAWKWETLQGEGLKQRIADVRNYCLLLAACLDELDEQQRQTEKTEVSYVRDTGW